MAFYDSSWQYFPDTSRSTWVYFIVYQGGRIDHGTHVPGTVAQSSAESEYNSVCTTGTALEHFRMLINEPLNKDPDIVPEEAPLFILDRNYNVCIAKHSKDTKYTINIYRRVNFVRNDEKQKIHKIDWCEGYMQLTYIKTRNVGENNLTPRMTYIMVSIEKW